MIKNIKEFRQSSSYVPPKNICAYQILDEKSNFLASNADELSKEVKNPCNNAKHNEIRDKLREQVYSQFNEKPETQSNGFISKKEFVAVDPTAEIDRKAKSLIAEEVHKLFNQFTPFQNVYGSGTERRCDVLKQSQNLLREKIKKQIYAPFNMTEEPDKLANPLDLNRQNDLCINEHDIGDHDLIDLNTNRQTGSSNVFAKTNSKLEDSSEVRTTEIGVNTQVRISFFFLLNFLLIIWNS